MDRSTMNCATYMCEEIVIGILSRLPTKSLIRFMAVCRLWKSIITSPQFRLVSNRPAKLLVHTTEDCYTLVEEGEQNRPRLMFETDFPLKSYFHDCVVGSDNGLVCSRIISMTNQIIIWNPCIRKHVVVPDDPTGDIEFASGFGGTTSSGGDYKYVRVVGLPDGEGSCKKAVNIYSLKAGTWRTKYQDWDLTQGVGVETYTCAALLRGRLHWIGELKNEIFPFELEDEVFENKIMLPESIQSCLDVKVTETRELLAVITNEQRRHPTLWVMAEYGDVNSWVKLCNIVLEELCRVDRNMVHLLNDGELLLCLRGIEFSYKQKLLTYNSKTMKTCDIGGGMFSTLYNVRGLTNYYKESLVLLGDHRARS